MRSRAAAIIIREGKMLLMRRHKPGRDYYILPGGGVKLDESFSDACVREVKEETGLDVAGLQQVFTNFYRGLQEQYFLARVSEGEPKLGGVEAERNSPDDSYSLEWVGEKEMEEVNLLPAAAKRYCLEVLRNKA
jgi:ADP-ribose pyrophosphatase YjhB (NUDIX family)